MAIQQRTLLIIDDDPGLQRQMRWVFDGCRVVVADSRKTALDSIHRDGPQVATLDLGLPPHPNSPSEGLAALEEILTVAPHTKVIVITGNDERENAIRAIGKGAYDFCSKPIEGDVLKLVVERAFRVYELEAENRRLRHTTNRPILEGIVTSSEKMGKVCAVVEKAAPAEATVLLMGESGTGKELLARALHQLSRRKNGPFVTINCAAIPENLLESELFGFEKGAFTGAVKQTLGRFELAEGGTVFLDEIGELPKQLQAKLLRVLQERVIERVGGRRTINLNVRVISATNRDLREEIKAGLFREDLYYRVSQLVVDIPPLRERGDDAILLAHSLLDEYGQGGRRPLRGFTREALSAISAYGWPGNVRELQNRVKRAAILAEGPYVTPTDLDLTAPADSDGPETLREARETAELKAIQRALIQSMGNVSQAAKVLGITRPTLYDLMKQYRGLLPTRKPGSEDRDAEGTGDDSDEVT